MIMLTNVLLTKIAKFKSEGQSYHENVKIIKLVINKAGLIFEENAEYTVRDIIKLTNIIFEKKLSENIQDDMFCIENNYSNLPISYFEDIALTHNNKYLYIFMEELDNDIDETSYDAIDYLIIISSNDPFSKELIEKFIDEMEETTPYSNILYIGRIEFYDSI